MIGHQYACGPELHLRDELLLKKHDKNVKCNALDTNRNIQSSTTQYHCTLKTTAMTVSSIDRKSCWDFIL
jgi:hypothetical protein